MARRTERTVVRTTNDLLNDRFWQENVVRGSISLRSLRNFAKMCRAIGDRNTTFTAKDLGVSGLTLEYASNHRIILFNQSVIQETKTEYQQVDDPDKRIVITRRAKVTFYQPVEGIDYHALADATTEYILSQIRGI